MGVGMVYPTLQSTGGSEGAS